jgi:hypothetical protein
MNMLLWLPIWISGLLSAAQAPIPTHIPLAAPLERYGFELIRDENGVKAYKHPWPDMIRIAAEGCFAVPPAAVAQAVLGYEHQVGVLSRLSEAEILDRGDNWMIVYQRLNLPIISDRDYVLSVRFSVEGNAPWVTFSSIAKIGPEPKPGVVRVVHHEGSWLLKGLDGGSATLARFQTEIDMGGLLPMWLARVRAGQELPAMFTEVAKLLPRTEPGKSSCLANGR